MGKWGWKPRYASCAKSEGKSIPTSERRPSGQSLGHLRYSHSLPLKGWADRGGGARVQVGAAALPPFPQRDAAQGAQGSRGSKADRDTFRYPGELHDQQPNPDLCQSLLISRAYKGAQIIPSFL